MTSGDRIELANGWRLWSDIWVRAAGFPAHKVLALAAPAASAAADAIASERDTDGLARFDQVFREDEDRIERALRAIAVDPRLREALTWQNRTALATGVDRLIASPFGVRNRDFRRRVRLIASYLQRYCVKNDTIGFFGPTAWGTLSSHVADSEVTPGSELLARRTVYFEQWAIDAVARAIAADREVRIHLRPRLLPGVYVTDSILHYAIDRTTPIDPAVARVLAACTGTTPARTIAAALVADETVDSADEVYELLDELVTKGLVQWTLEVPASLETPEAVLDRELEQIADAGVRARGLEVLGELVAAKAAVAEAAGDADRLAASLATLDATFGRLTGELATRRAGETYAGRTLVYEDCVRDLSLTFGSRMIDMIAPVLELLGQSARWFSSEIAQRYRVALRERYLALRGTSSAPVHYARFLDEVALLFPPDQTARHGLVGEVTRAVQDHWSQILGITSTTRRIDRSSAEIAREVAERFASARPGWAGARHLSPDLMFAARDLAALRRGELAVVVGEIHIGNTMLAACGIRQWTGDPDAFIRATEIEAGCDRVMPVEAHEQVTRADNHSWSPNDFDLELGRSPSWKPRERVLRIENLVVELAAESLVVCDRASGRRFDIITIVEQYLNFVASDFSPWPRAEHRPRITIDGVVVARELWQFVCAQLAFANLPHGAAQFRAARQWARQHELPRWVFARIPEERKPMFVDFESPVFVDMFASLVRHGKDRVTLTEMMPDLDETWLPDCAGNVYTSEARLVLVDPMSWQ